MPVTQAHIMADTESLGEAGVRWLEGLALPPRAGGSVRIPTITDPRGTDFAKAAFLGQTSAMLDLERRAIAAFVSARRRDDRHLHQLSDHPGADTQRARRLRRHRRGDLFQLGMRRALQFRGRAVGACRRASPGARRAMAFICPNSAARRCTFAWTCTPVSLNEWGALGGVIGRIAGNYWAVPVIEGIEQRAAIGSAQAFRRGDGELRLDCAVSPRRPDAGGERLSDVAPGGSAAPSRGRDDIDALQKSYHSDDRGRCGGVLGAATQPVRIARSRGLVRRTGGSRCRCLR